MMQYPVSLTREGSKTIWCRSPISQTSTPMETTKGKRSSRAVDALETYLMGMIEDREPIPEPRRPKRRQTVYNAPGPD